MSKINKGIYSFIAVAVFGSLFFMASAHALSSEITQISFNDSGPARFTVGIPNGTSVPLIVQTQDVNGNGEQVSGGGTVTVRVSSDSLTGRFDSAHNGSFTDADLTLAINTRHSNTLDFFYRDTAAGNVTFTATVIDSGNASNLPVNSTTTLFKIVVAGATAPSIPTPPPTDITPPVITLAGSSTIQVSVGDDYVDAGASALDDVDGDITSRIVTVNLINTSTVGIYTVTYNVSDAAGNAAASVTRTVNVVAPAVVTPAPQLEAVHPVAEISAPTPAPASESTPNRSGGGGTVVYLSPYVSMVVGSPITSVVVPPSAASELVSPNAPVEVLGTKITRLDELIAFTKIGQTGVDVVELQNELKVAGFFPQNINSTGWYGSITLKAVLDYERSSSEHDLLAFLTTQTKRGQRGDLISQLQDELKKRGFIDKGVSSTGYYGSITEEAVKKYYEQV